MAWLKRPDQNRVKQINESTMTKSLTAIASLALSLTLGLTASLSWGAIYTCTDASGRKLTSDRPIAECADRDQKELNSNATVKRTVKPVMTAQEQRAFDEKQKIEAEEQTRAEEEKRKNRALLSRYPNRESHDKERAEALGQIDVVIQAATKRMGELGGQRKTIDTELEFYKKDLSKMPVSLKRQIEDNDNSLAVQKRFVADQDSEKKRLNARFDEDLVKLKSLWLLAGSAPGTAATAPVVVKK
jgi:Domain of unknown function (DUF4124)